MRGDWSFTELCISYIIESINIKEESGIFEMDLNMIKQKISYLTCLTKTTI